MNKPNHIHKYLICLTDKAVADLKWVTGYMQVSQSEAIRQGLDLMAARVIEKAENRSKGLAVLDANVKAAARGIDRKSRRAR